MTVCGDDLLVWQDLNVPRTMPWWDFIFSYTMIAGFIAVYIFGYLKYVAPASLTCT
jgi:hypothetical protein